MNGLTSRQSNGTPEGFEFISIEDASHDFDAETVYALKLRQRMYGDKPGEFTALYCSDWDNVMLVGNQSLSKEEYQERAMAAFCFLSVILK